MMVLTRCCGCCIKLCLKLSSAEMMHGLVMLQSQNDIESKYQRLSCNLDLAG